MKKKTSGIFAREQQHYRERDEANIYVPSPPIPKNMLMDLTNACNHACVFCFSPHQTRKKKLINNHLGFSILSQAADAGVEEVGFYNVGDPFMHKNLDGFVTHAKKVGFKYTYLSTNGALATPERAKPVIDAGLDSIKFSLNAGTRESYKIVHGRDEFDLAVKHLKYISNYRKEKKKDLYIAITYVITKQNHKELDNLKKELSEYVDEIAATPFHSQNGQMTPAEKLLAIDGSASDPFQKDKLENPICSNPFKRLHVTSEGYLGLCCVDYQNYVAVEDLNKMSLLEAWNSETFKKAREMHLSQNLTGTICDKCWNGSDKPYEPIKKELAVEIDFIEKEVDQLKLIQKRLS